MRFSLFFALFLLSAPVQAHDGCSGEAPVLEKSAIWDFQGDARSDFYLPSQSSFQTFLTQAAAHISWDGMLRFDFDHKVSSGTTGLPYNLYRVEVIVGEGTEKFHHLHDLTQDCTASGVSMFPGQWTKFPSVDIPPRSDGKPRGKEPVLIRIWGHL